MLLQRRKLMDQKAFEKLQASLEKLWEKEAHKRVEQRRSEEQIRAPAPSQKQKEQQDSSHAAPPAPSTSRRASLPPRAPRPVQDASKASAAASAHDKQSAGHELAEVSGQPRRALGELPVQ